MRIHILGVPRGGTTYLYDIVRRYHSPLQTVEYGNEPFHPTLYYSKDVDLDVAYADVIRVNKLQKRSVIKTHVQHLIDLRERNLLDRFKSTVDYNVVIIRRNIFDVILSSIVSSEQDEWFKYNNEVTPIIVDTEMFKYWWKGIYYDTLRIYKNEFDIEYDEIVYYENFTRKLSRDWSNMKLCNTYYTSLVDLQSAHTKAPPKETVVSNYDELKQIALEYAKQEEFKELQIDNNLNFIKLGDFNN